MFRYLHEEEPWPVFTSLSGFIIGIICVCTTVWALPWPMISLTSALIIVLVVCFYRLALRQIVNAFLWYFTKYLRQNEKNPQHYLPNLSSAFLLGVAFALGFCLCFASLKLQTPRLLWPFALYIIFLSFFHWSEFFFAALTHPARVSVDLYMLEHSPEYGLAALACFVEYCLEVYFWPGKSTAFFGVNLLGLIMCVVGECIRKVAIFTAAESFSHYVEHTLRKEHTLVTTGVYSWFRHPAYVGWFYWSWGTQLLLVNPICSIAYPIAAHQFFSERVLTEEASLIHFFGEAYRTYQAKVSTGLPFIKGFFPMEH